MVESAAGAGSGGAIYLKGDVITNNGVIRATGGVSTNSSPMNGGGGRIAMHTVKAATFGTINVGNGSISVPGDMGAKPFNSLRVPWYLIQRVPPGIIPEELTEKVPLPMPIILMVKK